MSDPTPLQALQQAILYAKQVIEASSEYRLGRPDAEQAAAALSKALAALPAAAVPTQQPSDEQLRAMVNRFLGWKLPATFGPDAGISFLPYHPQQTPDSHLWPVGTNLLTATEAEAMLRHVVAGALSSPAPAAAPQAAGDEWLAKAIELADRYARGDHHARVSLHVHLAAPQSSMSHRTDAAPNAPVDGGSYPDGFDATCGLPAHAMRTANGIMCSVIGKREWDVPMVAAALVSFAQRPRHEALTPEASTVNHAREVARPDGKERT